MEDAEIAADSHKRPIPDNDGASASTGARIPLGLPRCAGTVKNAELLFVHPGVMHCRDGLMLRPDRWGHLHAAYAFGSGNGIDVIYALLIIWTRIVMFVRLSESLSATVPNILA